MPLFKITKKRARKVRKGRFYRTGSTIELTPDEAEELEDELGLKPAATDAEPAEPEPSPAAVEEEPEESPPEPEAEAETEEEPAATDAEPTASEVLERNSYNEMLSFAAKHSSEPLKSKGREAVRAIIQGMIDESA